MGIVAQQNMMSEIGGLFQRVRPLQQRRAADRDQALGDERFAVKIRPVALPVPDGQVHVGPVTLAASMLASSRNSISGCLRLRSATRGIIQRTAKVGSILIVSGALGLRS
jgi:hypothetical protein